MKYILSLFIAAFVAFILAALTGCSTAGYTHQITTSADGTNELTTARSSSFFSKHSLDSLHAEASGSNRVIDVKGSKRAPDAASIRATGAAAGEAAASAVRPH